MEFLEEKIFDREQYDTYIRRIHYDDRDAVMYEKMLHFLFPYIVEALITNCLVCNILCLLL